MTIVYHRIVPLSGINPLHVPAGDAESGGVPRYVHPTEDLRALSLAFVLGVRAKGVRTVTGQDPEKVRGTEGRTALSSDAQIYGGQAAGFHVGLAPGVSGPLQMSTLVSFPFVQAYFRNVLAGQVIRLDQTLEDAKDALVDSERATGALGRFDAAVALADSLGIGAAGAPGRPNPLTASTLLSTQDVAKQMGLPGSDVAVEGDALQGIFARSYGPFLVGKGGRAVPAPLTTANLPQPFTVNGRPKTVQPHSVSRNEGDELAFHLLEQLLRKAGAQDFLIDGICKSVAEEDPSDALSNEQIQARGLLGTPAHPLCTAPMHARACATLVRCL